MHAQICVQFSPREKPISIAAHFNAIVLEPDLISACHRPPTIFSRRATSSPSSAATFEFYRHRNKNGDLVLDIYPLSSYYFSSKPAVSFKDETLADRARRLKSNYDAHGMRTCVEAVILVELFKHPHLLLLQAKNCVYKLPGGRLRPGESDVDGLKRKLSSKLSADEDYYQTQWEVGECIGTWWKSDFETLPYPYLPSSGRSPKECTKLYLVKLPSSRDFIVPKNLKLLAVPLCQLHESRKTYGSIISGIPQLLSRFSINMVGS